MNKMIKVTKEVTFDCAHMLSGHQALCKNLHGHTYKVQVTVGGDTIADGSSKEMVIDFKHLKRAINEVIVDRFDHAVIFSAEEYRNEAEQALFEWACKYDLRHYVMPTRTTAENMAVFFKEAIHTLLVGELAQKHIDYVSVRVYETPTSFAEV